jgi:hypothetical protein
VTFYQPNPDVRATGQEPAEFVEPANPSDRVSDSDSPPDPHARPTGEPPVAREPYDGAVALGPGGRVRIIVHIDDLESADWVGVQRTGDEPIAIDAFGAATSVQLREDDHPLCGAVASASLEHIGDTRVRLIGRDAFLS